MKGMPGDFHISYPDTLDHYCRSSAAFSKEYTTSLLRQGVTDVEASMFEARLSQALRMSEQYDVPLYCSSYGSNLLVSDSGVEALFIRIGARMAG